jgi:S-adenosylmethionine/arginine decarboxylase-like enzyme
MEVEAVHPDGLTNAAVEALADALAGYFELTLPCVLAHRYVPQGLSVVRHGGEGRLALHTWPELNVATIDLWAPQNVLQDRVEALSGWLAERACHRVVRLSLHPHPRGPVGVVS